MLVDRLIVNGKLFPVKVANKKTVGFSGMHKEKKGVSVHGCLMVSSDVVG